MHVNALDENDTGMCRILSIFRMKPKPSPDIFQGEFVGWNVIKTI